MHLDELVRLAYSHHQQGRLDLAEILCAEVIAAIPDHVDTHYLLGVLAFQSQRFELAVETFQQVTHLAPDSRASWVYLGCAFNELGKPIEAAAVFQKAIQRFPSLSEAYFNLGRSLSQLERFDEAAAALEHVLQLAPDDAETLSLLVNQCQHAGLWDRCNQLIPRVLDIVNHCDPDRISNPHRLIEPSSFVAIGWPTSMESQWRCSRSWSNVKFPIDCNPYPHTARTAAKIRLGYVSADFRQHVMGTHLVELFEMHDRERFEVFGYSIGPDDRSPVRQRIETAFDHFFDLHTTSTNDIAQNIHEDQIDILVDLQGHTSMSRPGIYAKKPAPIQVTYLGFPCTMGCDFIDYILVDEYVAPEESQRYFTEKIVQLPGCYQVNDRNLERANWKTSRKECGLPETSFVFCSFNNVFKITRPIFEIWMRILASVDQSVLWLPQFSPCATNNLKSEAVKCGIDPSRLVFAPVLPLVKHCVRHGLADLFLDTFPYNAHGTAALSLRCQVPIVTLSGETMASRVAGSLLREVGLSELIANDVGIYELLAVKLATDRDYFRTVQSKLKTGLESTDLFDGQAFARKAERAYELMMERQLNKQEPQGFQVQRDGSVRWLHANQNLDSPC